jgi:DNA modification methylase
MELDTDIEYFIMDCIDGMKEHVKAESATMVFADPPFGIDFGKNASIYNYGVSKNEDIYYDDSKTGDKYVEWSKKWLPVIKDHVLMKNGILVLMSGWTYSSDLCVVAKNIGFQLLNKVTWRFEFGPHASRKFTSSHYDFLILLNGRIKDNGWKFDMLIDKGSVEDVIRDLELFLEEMDSMERKKKVIRLAKIILNMIHDERDKISAPDLFDDIRRLTKRYINIKHPCKLNEDVPIKFIRHFTDPGDLVVDPFMGTGVAAVAAKKTGRKYIGFEIAKKYEKSIYDMWNRRISSSLDGFRS